MDTMDALDKIFPPWFTRCSSMDVMHTVDGDVSFLKSSDGNILWVDSHLPYLRSFQWLMVRKTSSMRAGFFVL